MFGHGQKTHLRTHDSKVVDSAVIHPGRLVYRTECACGYTGVWLYDKSKCLPCPRAA